MFVIGIITDAGKSALEIYTPAQRYTGILISHLTSINEQS